ncbi:MAG: Immunity protein SdpI [Firmicutes bacterium]|nr:Immunity protein SdpI [Bacillota bacterium]MDI6705341.1 SdpI family protein [Bacillota bacterium]
MKKRDNILMLAILIIVFAVAIYAYIELPSDKQYPVHWSFKGEPDRYGSKLEVVLIGPIITAFIYVLTAVLPKVDPKKANYPKFKGEYILIRQIIMGLLAAIYLISIMAAFGKQVRIDVWVPAIVGLLFVVLGNYMSRIKQSWFVGIKTPWTLSNEKVWEKTHRFGGRVFVIVGLIFVLNAFIGFITNMWIFLVLLLGLSLSPILYSYYIYKKLENES